MWRPHGTRYPARHHPALCLLARRRRAARRVDFGRAGDSELCAVRPGSYTSRSLPALRVPRFMPWWVCRETTPAGRVGTARLLLSYRSWATPQPDNPHGRKPGSPQAEQLLHDGSHRAGSGFVRNTVSRVAIKSAAVAKKIVIPSRARDLLFLCSTKKQIPRYGRNDNPPKSAANFLIPGLSSIVH